MKKKTVRNIIITFIFALLLYYFMLPPLNLQAPQLYTYIITVLLCYFFISFFSTMDPIVLKTGRIEKTAFNKVIYLVLGIVAVIFLINFVMSPIFMADSYANRIEIDETKSFVEDVAPVDFNKIPLLDKDSSRKLGDRTMGQMPDLVSQFYVSNLYTQINYNNEIIRVTPLEYASFIKYFTNRSEGVKGYITVDSVNGESKLVKLEKGMKYVPSALFSEDLHRKIRFTYPTEIFGTESFEIDNDGNPYWIIPTIKYSGIGLRKDINGVIVLNAITGDSKKYNVGEIPSWIDHVFEADLIIEQFDNWGEYKNGFWNSIFGQKNVVNTTEGYNYIVQDDDVYIYTGVTSVSSDESNLGFILTNMRTKETHYYEVPGAEEYSAMASAQGLVQEKKYESTFPLLINFNNRPTYLLSLKDNAGLVKMYAFVDVEDYQKVITSDASLGIQAAAEKYTKEFSANNTSKTDLLEATITVKKIKTATIDGLTQYYITDTENKNYVASIKVNQAILPFMEVGDKLIIQYAENTELNVIKEIKKS